MEKGSFKTKKRYGQHLLIAPEVIKKIVEFIDIKEGDIVVEIGVGTGNLTQAILEKKPYKLFGIEIDKQAYPIIQERFKDYQNFTLIQKDFFDVDLRELTEGKKIKLVGNLPYNVASLILVRTAFYTDIIQLSVFMVQKEVAQKLTAKPNTKDYTFLSIFIQTFFKVEYMMSVPPRFFRPPPKVVSAVVRLTPRTDTDWINRDRYKKLVSKLFEGRRKMLKRKIDPELLKKANIQPTSRVEDLSVEDFINLYKVVEKEEEPELT
ncbi:MAG: 16S rRNA (adenine(1518)-N(6)/adenine(1519)-N(6))-dimethyltransferase RsmA [Aquificae bacterium]|nr:16S rRNA (adenine(1518)-N(6)/adenine(1519)-N(6))-dimethyltransferase RsmA [Aquificota bacterium]